MSIPPEPPTGRARVGYLGPEGTFTEEALLGSAAEGAVEPVGLAGIYETVAALRSGEVDWAVAPIENSLEGSIVVTLDLLAGEPDDVEIVGEALVRVRHSLITAGPVNLAQIQTVLTHPQVPGQCTRFLRGELGHARVAAASSTAEAVRTVVSEGRSDQAALGTALAARIYGGTILREGVEDRDDNETRFVWLARRGESARAPLADAHATGEWKTSLVFWGPGAEQPGWLLRCLEEFARRDIHLTRIESRPLRGRLGTDMFFIDLAGSSSQAPVADAIAGLRERCEEVRVLGSYHSAARPRVAVS